MKKTIKDYIALEIEGINKLDQSKIQEFIKILDKTLKNEGTIYICGNGGSSSTSSHFQCDFNKMIFAKTNKRFRFNCLTDNLAMNTAVTNDFNYESLFKHQVYNKLKKNDIVIGISGSGNSKNVINIIEYAKSQGNKTITLTGFNGGKVSTISDLNILTPINNIKVVEDTHLMIEHLISVYFINKYGMGEYDLDE